MKVDVKIKKLHKDAKIPVYAHDTDAGADLYSIESYVIPPNEVCKARTGLAIKLPEGYEWQIRPRSGLSYKRKLLVCNSPGTVDENFTGEVCVLLFNPTPHVIKLDKHERIAQAVLKEVPHANFIEVDELPVTDRGEGGFGSTGMKELKTVDLTEKVNEEVGEPEINLGVDEEGYPRLSLIPENNGMEEEELVEGAIALIDGEETKSIMEIDTSLITDNQEVISKVNDIVEELTEPRVVKPFLGDGSDTLDHGAYVKYDPMVDQAIEAFIKTDENKALFELALEEASLEDIKTKVIFRIVENRLNNVKTIIVNELKEVVESLVII